MPRLGLAFGLLLLFVVLTLAFAAPRGETSGDITPPPRTGNDAPLAFAKYGDKPVPIGTNMHGIVDWSPAWVFVDVFTHARTWIPQTTQPGGPWNTGEKLDVDEYGWVKSLKTGQAASALMCWDIEGHYPAGKYICLYEGEGDIDFAYAASVIERRPGRMIVNVEPDKGGIMLKITRTNPGDYIRNIRLIMPGFEATYKTQPFHPRFLASLEPFSVLRFMDFQSTNNSVSAQWADRTTPQHATQSRGQGVALEYMIDLCNRLGAEPWFCMPHLADDDYVRNFAKMVRDGLEPTLRIHLEHSNEVWNTMFSQAGHARERGLALKLSSDPYEAQLRYHAERSVAIFAIWEEVFGGHDRFNRVLASQHVNPWTGTTIMDWKDAYKNADTLAVAPYFGGDLGRGDRAGEIVTMTLDDVLDAAAAHSIERHKKTKINAIEAARRGLELIAYEGGPALVGVGHWQEDEHLNSLFFRANRHPRMRTLYYDSMHTWQEQGGGLFINYTHMSRDTKYGCWGIIRWQDEPLSAAPKYQALLDYKNADPRK